MPPATLETPLLNQQTYLSDPARFFTVDGYSVRNHALLLPERIEAARKIYDAVPAIAQEASARLMKYLAARERQPAPNLQQAPCQRDLELVGQLIAGVAVGENYAQFENHVLRHMVIGVARGYDVPDGTAMLMMYAIQVSREKLTGAAQRLFEGYCWQAMEYLRNGSAGAYLCINAHELASYTYERMAASVRRLDDAYGAVTRQKAIRDISMMLVGAQEALSCMSRPQARANMLAWIFEYVAADIPKYTDTVWMPLFRHLWEMAVVKLPTPYASVVADVFRTLGGSGRRFREAAKMYDRARELARNAAYAHVGADASSTGDSSHAAQIAIVFESLIRKIALHFALGTPPNQTGLAREWLQFHCNRMPVPEPATAALMAQTLHVATRNAMRTSWTKALDALFEAATHASQHFAEIVEVNHCIPEIVANVLRFVQSKVKLTEPQQTERRLLIFTSKCFEVASRGTLAENSELLWHWHHYCLDGASADAAEVQAAMYQLLPEAASKTDVRHEAHLMQFLKDVATTSVHIPAARMLRGPQAAAFAKAALEHANITDRRVPANELIFLLDRIAHAMLRGGGPGALAQLTDWFGTHCTPHHLPNTPIRYQQRLMEGLAKACLGALPEPSRPLFEQVMNGLIAQLPWLMSSFPIEQHARQIADTTIQRFAATREWTDLGMSGLEDKSARDLHLLLLACSHALRTHNEFTQEQLRDWTRDNLVGFLRNETFKSVQTMLRHAHDVARELLEPDVADVALQTLRNAYNVKP